MGSFSITYQHNCLHCISFCRRSPSGNGQVRIQNPLKQLKTLCKQTLLLHYDDSIQLVPACDASPWGLGAVLSHIMPDGVERPVAYSSRTLTTAEKNYSQLEKEGRKEIS